MQEPRAALAAESFVAGERSIRLLEVQGVRDGHGREERIVMRSAGLHELANELGRALRRFE